MTSDKKADFSGVSASVDSTAQQRERADFSDVSSKVDSSADIVGGATYIVRSGDTLSAIAKEHYGKSSAWRFLFDANRDVIDDPDRIYPGQQIKIPPRAEAD